MRPESNNNSLDLNNYPEDYSTRDSRNVMEEGSSSGGKDGKDEETGKVYECRFCSLKFCKSQALGGHMNRHRQERETETLNRARQLVFSNDNSAVARGEPFRSMYQQQPRLFTAAASSSSTMLQPPTMPPQGPHQPLLYTSPIPLVPYPSQYPHHAQQPPINDYYVGHATPQYHLNYMGVGMGGPDSTNYTCVGSPVGPVLGHGSGRGSNMAAEGSSGGRDGSDSNQEEGLRWGRSYAGI